MMNPHSLGRVNVPTPGTPVPLTTDRSIIASVIRVQVIAGLTGKMYVGTANGWAGAISAGVLAELWPNSTGGIDDSWKLQPGQYRLCDYAIDAAVAGEGLLVSWWDEE